MPYLELVTNVPLDEAQQMDLVNVYMAVSYTYNKTLIHGGTSDPCFQARVMSIGLTTDKCPSVSAAIAAELKDKLGLDASRGYMYLFDPTGERVGWKGTTFSEL
ncbi:Tautomerase/MIF [Serendipita vermifera]|nr:Tautomerase/MIF [Serendipita vermifera]